MRRTIIKFLQNQSSRNAISMYKLIDYVKSQTSFDKDLFDKEILTLRDDGIVELEVGSPIGRTQDELDAMTVTRNYNRFAYIRIVSRYRTIRR